jgi:hypothetical protein
MRIDRERERERERKKEIRRDQRKYTPPPLLYTLRAVLKGEEVRE